MKAWMLFVLAGVGALLAFWSTMKPMIDDNRIRNKVLNFDQGMKNYYFLPAFGKEETLAALAGPQALKNAQLRFCPEDETLVLSREGAEAGFRLRFATDELGRLCLRVSRAAEERAPGTIPYLVNALFIKNLGAKPIDYRKGEEFFEE